MGLASMATMPKREGINDPLGTPCILAGHGQRVTRQAELPSRLRLTSLSISKGSLRQPHRKRFSVCKCRYTRCSIMREFNVSDEQMSIITKCFQILRGAYSRRKPLEETRNALVVRSGHHRDDQGPAGGWSCPECGTIHSPELSDTEIRCDYCGAAFLVNEAARRIDQTDPTRSWKHGSWARAFLSQNNLKSLDGL